MKALCEAAMVFAARGANEYVRVHKLNVNPDDLAIHLKACIVRAMPQALEDAKEAFAYHMEQVGQQTFAASMVNAGIEAAKRASIPVEVYAGKEAA